MYIVRSNETGDFSAHINTEYEPITINKTLVRERCESIVDFAFLVPRYNKISIDGYLFVVEYAKPRIMAFEGTTDTSPFRWIHQHMIDLQNGVTIADIGQPISQIEQTRNFKEVTK